MVFGTGVDNVELSRIQKALTRSERFVEQVLTAVELEKYNSFQSTARKTEFLAGRWAAKEAFSKAYGTGFGKALGCLLYTSPSPRDRSLSRMPSSA